MLNLSTEHLIKCINQKDKYKLTQQYLKQVEIQNQYVYDYINQAFYNILVPNNHPPTSKLYALRFFKDIFISAQFQLIDGLDQKIIKQIVKVCQFDKQNSDKSNRGSSYFQKVEKRIKSNDIQKVSYSFVLFATQIIYVLGTWHPLDQNNQPSDYSLIFEKLKKAKIPFPLNDKQLKFFKPEQKELFLKNYKEWFSKLPQIEEESDEGDEKENIHHKSRKTIKSKQRLPQLNQTSHLQNDKTELSKTLKLQGQEKPTQLLTTKEPQIADNKISKIQSINQSQLKKLEQSNRIKDDEIMKLKKKLQQIIIEKDVFEEKNTQLEESLTEMKSKELNSQQEENLKYKNLEGKYQDLKAKYSQLQSKNHQLKSKLQQSQLIKQKQNMENQQQNNLLRRKMNDKSQVEQRLRLNAEQSGNQLKQARQKIGRLERQIEQLNNIRNSYKNIMADNSSTNKVSVSNQVSPSKQNLRVQELQLKIEQITQLYTKQIIQLKSNIQSLKSQTQKLSSNLSSKETIIQSLKCSLNENIQKIKYIKSQKTQIDKDSNQIEQLEQIKLQKSPQHLQPQLKTQSQFKSSNSMSQYLQSQTTILKKLLQSKQNSMFSQKKNQNSPPAKTKNTSLGKTQNSLQKRKQLKNRCSAGKTFHFANYETSKNFQVNDFSHQKSYQNFSKKGHSSSSGNLWAGIPKTFDFKPEHQTNQFFNKKSSALLLERKSDEQKFISSKQNTIQTLIPYIDNYFSSNSTMNSKDNLIFRSLCLYPHERSRQPIYSDQFFQIKLITSNIWSKEIYVLNIINIGYSSAKVKIVSCHDEFKILGEKTRLINSNSIAEYQIQTKNKDLNLRYPVISLIVTQNLGNKVKNLTYNIPLPLTMLEFTEMNDEMPEFYHSEMSNLKILKSQKFFLNDKFILLKQCFPNLSFKNKNKPSSIVSRQIQIIWQGNLRHRFIENVDVYLKIIQVGNQASLQFCFRNQDQISENYSKVMIQTLMFLLQ